ncbi:hypothetical protein [Halomarina oriensis]|uniref:Uncharacterized protein n=1 Tax=Halomarina oriensis TaxID=671145 RepID=A0A6B0GX22_9EURY|nr:hypothetical protein [Halomarina oriensis]MWG36685.1 hypothetical protein [Halomarina oriensis]
MQPRNHILLSMALCNVVKAGNETYSHWAGKALVVAELAADPQFDGKIETERMTGGLRGDVVCTDNSTETYPRKFVVEVEHSRDKYRVQKTRRHARYGYAVFWVFTERAISQRSNTEADLAEITAKSPSLGAVSVATGEVELGEPLGWNDLAYPRPTIAFNELAIPQYDRSKRCYDHGDFMFDDRVVSVIDIKGDATPLVCEYVSDGQQTLPQPASWTMRDLWDGINSGDVIRAAPIRGPP